MRGRSSDQKNEWSIRPVSRAGKKGPWRPDAHAREEDDTRNVALEAEKLAGEIAQQPLQTEHLEAQITRDRAEARAADFRVFREKALLILSLVLIIFILVLALVDPQLLESIGQTLSRVAPR
jgi:hypothetical protein